MWIRARLMTIVTSWLGYILSVNGLGDGCIGVLEKPFLGWFKTCMSSCPSFAVSC